jgi:5-methylcytosine-specific restriction endonuclease McrA
MAKLDKICSHCGVPKPRSEFYRQPDCRDGYYPYCKECKKAQVTSYKLSSKDWRRYLSGATIANWRAKRFGIPGRLRAKDIQKLFTLYGQNCLKCGKAGKLTVDHIVPLSLGGANHLRNLQILCPGCNSRKGRRIADYRPSFLVDNKIKHLHEKAG